MAWRAWLQSAAPRAPSLGSGVRTPLPGQHSLRLGLLDHHATAVKHAGCWMLDAGCWMLAARPSPWRAAQSKRQPPSNQPARLNSTPSFCSSVVNAGIDRPPSPHRPAVNCQNHPPLFRLCGRRVGFARKHCSSNLDSVLFPVLCSRVSYRVYRIQNAPRMVGLVSQLDNAKSLIAAVADSPGLRY